MMCRRIKVFDPCAQKKMLDYVLLKSVDTYFKCKATYLMGGTGV